MREVSDRANTVFIVGNTYIEGHFSFKFINITYPLFSEETI